MAEERKFSLGERLDSVYRTGRISHAYILEGDPEVTEKAAEAFAKRLVTSPADILFPEHEKPSVFGVDDVRGNVQGTVYIRPYGEARKVYILRDAELLNAQAQNALLKTIEEPPEYVVMLLCTKNTGVFLETILSRCVVFSEAEDPGAFPEDRGDIAERTRGLLRSRDFSEEAVQNFVKEVSKSKLCLGLVPESVRCWFRDVLYLKCGGAAEGLIDRGDQGTLRQQAGQLGFGDAEKVLLACSEAELRLDANVSPELTLRSLMNTAAEALRRK